MSDYVKSARKEQERRTQAAQGVRQTAQTTQAQSAWDTWQFPTIQIGDERLPAHARNDQTTIDKINDGMQRQYNSMKSGAGSGAPRGTNRAIPEPQSWYDNALKTYMQVPGNSVSVADKSYPELADIVLDANDDPEIEDIKTPQIQGGNFNAPEGLNILDGYKGEKKDTTVKNSIPGWWDYLKQTKGGYIGALASVVGGGLQGLGNATMGFAHGASLGKTAAPKQVEGDPFGLQGYGKLQHDAIQDQQGIEAKQAEANLEINKMIDQLPIEQHQNMHALNAQLTTLRDAGRINAETQKEIIKATIEGDFKRIEKMAGVKMATAIKAGFTMRPMETITAAANTVGTIVGGTSDANAKTDIKKVSYIKPNKRKDISRGKKLDRLAKWK